MFYDEFGVPTPLFILVWFIGIFLVLIISICIIWWLIKLSGVQPRHKKDIILNPLAEPKKINPILKKESQEVIKKIMSLRTELFKEIDQIIIDLDNDININQYNRPLFKSKLQELKNKIEQQTDYKIRKIEALITDNEED